MQDRVPSATALILLSAAVLCAQDVTQAVCDDDSGWVRAWIRASDNAKASQPHFVAPIVTTHVMLVQQFRYDMSWQQDPSGGTVASNYGDSRGLEIIPSSRLEVGIFPPAYVVASSDESVGH